MPDEIAWDGHNGPLMDRLGDAAIVDCEACGFKHVVPLPTPEELEALYEHDYYAVDKPSYIEEHRDDEDWWQLVYDERYDLLEVELPADRRKLLDVGSGAGYFLKRGVERGWSVLGIEPSHDAAAYARDLGVEVVEAFLDPTSASSLGAFDAIHMQHVLEHVPDPESMLRLVHGLLEPGGVLCVVAPNDYNGLQDVVRRAVGHDAWWVVPEHHLNYFSHASLAALLQRCGFEVLRSTTSFPMELFVLLGDDYIGNPTVGRAMHAKRKELETTIAAAGRQDIRAALYDALAAAELGREAILYARKKR